MSGKFKGSLPARRAPRGKNQRVSAARETAMFLLDRDSVSDGCRRAKYYLPAAGYFNGTSRNNAGTNGNYWSATRNSGNANNAYNLNFNSGNQNVNNNNRHYGFTVRPVCE